MLSPLALALLLQQSSSPQADPGVGLEWMIVASVLVPAALLVVLVWLGRRHRV